MTDTVVSNFVASGSERARPAKIFAAKNFVGEKLSGRDRMLLASDLLPPCDFFAVLLAAYLSFFVGALFSTSAGPGLLHLGNIALLGASLATYVLYDKNFAAAASHCNTIALLRSYGTRSLVTIGALWAIGAATSLFDAVPRVWTLSWFLVSMALTGVIRLALARRVCALQRKGALRETVAVVGAGRKADEFNRQLRRIKSPNVELVGIFDDVIAGRKRGTTWPIHTLDRLAELNKARRLDWIVITVAEGEEKRLRALVAKLKVLAVPIALCPRTPSAKIPCKTIDYVGSGMPVLLLADRPIRRWDAIVKTMEDVLLGGAITLLALPLLAAIAVAIRMTSPGPVIFKQRRHTFNNTEFDIYKFRTMYWRPGDDRKLEQTSRNDQRVTPLGRWLRASSLDELPQLFNVLKGEMSLIGPRPHAVNMRTEDRLGCEITECYAHRHRVKPGLTGWSQVNGARGATHTVAQLQRRIELDLYYIDNWSLWLDVKILFMTWRAVIKATNAF